MPEGNFDRGLSHRPPLSVTLVVAPPRGAEKKQPPVKEPPLEPDEDQEDEEEGDGEEDDDLTNQIVEEAALALRGQSRAPEVALRNFVDTFGKDALEELRQMVLGEQSGEQQQAPVEQPVEQRAGGGRLLHGAGGGMADTIPAHVGDQDVLLSEGEFVIPADVVSMLGDGSTDAGARVLEDMMSRVRQSKTGDKKQAKAMKGGVLP